LLSRHADFAAFAYFQPPLPRQLSPPTFGRRRFDSAMRCRLSQYFRQVDFTLICMAISASIFISQPAYADFPIILFSLAA